MTEDIFAQNETDAFAKPKKHHKVEINTFVLIGFSFLALYGAYQLGRRILKD